MHPLRVSQSGPGAPDRYFDPPGKPTDGNDRALVLEHPAPA
jgi:hypothetical protein